MKTEIAIEYEGISIAYDEQENVWRFELRGRKRSAESLAKAKEAIDKPLPSDKKAFERFRAYKASLWNPSSFAAVEVTSIADGGWRGRTEVWVINSGKREKVAIEELWEATPANEALIEQWTNLKAQKEKLDAEQTAVVERMSKVTLKEEEFA